MWGCSVKCLAALSQHLTKLSKPRLRAQETSSIPSCGKALFRAVMVKLRHIQSAVIRADAPHISSGIRFATHPISLL